jgi:hypothetical protein
MRRVIFALLAPAAVAATLTASGSAAILSPQRPVLDRSQPATDVAYRGVRRTTVRGPRGGVYHSRTVVRGRGYYGPRYYGARYYGHRHYAGYYGPRYYGARYYGPRYYAGYYGPRYYGARYYGPRVYASRGFYGHRGVYARRGFYGHRVAYRGGGRVYASRAVGVRRR